MLFLYISLIIAIPKFSYILADDNSKSECKAIEKQIINYFSDGIYKNPDFNKKQAKEISQAFQEFLCTHDDFDINDAFKKMDSDTELLLIDAYEIDDEIDFEDLKKKVAVQISGAETDYLKHYSTNPEKMNKLLNDRFSILFKSMISISYKANSQSKNLELTEMLSKNNQKQARFSDHLLEIDGKMKKKVSFLAIFDQFNLQFDGKVDCDYVYLYRCELTDSVDIESQNLLVDPITYDSIQNLKEVDIDVKQFGIIAKNKATIRLVFSSDDVNIQFSDIQFPADSEQYDNMISEPIPVSWFKTICVLSESTQYSLYLDVYFNPTRNTLPGINISINEPEEGRFKFMAAKESVDIKTESWTDGAWDQFPTKPSINVDADPSKYTVNAPPGIVVTNSDPNNANNNKKKKTLIIIISCVCAAAVIIIIVVVVVVVKCRDKYAHKIVYINDDNQNKASLTNDTFKDNIDKNEDKELSDDDLEKEKLEANGQLNTSNNNVNSNSNANLASQSHESLNGSQQAVQYPQSGQSHPGYPQPQQYTPTGSNNNLPTDTPNSAYTVPF